MRGIGRRTALKGLAFAAAPLHAAVETSKGKPRLRPAICAYSFRQDLESKKMTYADVIDFSVEAGVDGVDLTVYWFPDTSDSFLLPLRRHAYRSGIDLYSISVSTNLCQQAPDAQANELAKIRKWVDVAEKLSAGHIRVFGGTVPAGATEDQAAGWVAEILKRGADYAGSKGVILGLENHGGITAKASRILEIVKKVDSPWVGVNLDTGNFHEDPYAQIEKCVPYAVNVQVKERVKVGERHEESDWTRVAAMLRGSGYKGYLALEYEEKEPVRTAASRLIPKLKRICAAG